MANNTPNLALLLINHQIALLLYLYHIQIPAMRSIHFTLKQDYIELIKLLKLLNLAENGAHAKLMVDEGNVKLNGATENRKRAKLKTGDIVECNNVRIIIKNEIKK